METEPDFSAHKLGVWDTVDLSVGGREISIKSTKHYGHLLLLETKEWDENAVYIPNKDRNGATEYDVIRGWRANASYFYIAKEFVRDNIDMDILEELLSLGGLGIQYCIKSELAYSKLQEIKDDLTSVKYNEFNEKYNMRDVMARKRMRELVDSDANRVTKVFSTLFEGEV